MALELDSRQRAMLQEMGITVWMPDAPTAQVPVQAVTANTNANTPVSPAARPAIAAAPAARVLPPVAPAAVNVMAAAKAIDVTAATDVQYLDAHGLAQEVAACTACGLCAGRKKTTLQAQTIRQTDWMVVGDPPDEDEDREATPFAQQAGILLDNMLKAVAKDRHAAGAAGAYLTNVVKCKPPHGRIPQPEELAQCAAYLEREIALVQPKVIIAMGRFAHQVLLSANPPLAMQPLGKLRGTVYRYQQVPVVVTYAPKDLLRRSADKAKAWADLCLAMDSI